MGSTGKFTIVCEFDGGTYVSQVEAADQVEAVRRWAVNIRIEKPIPGATAYVAKAVLREMDQYGLAALDGLKGVWCFTASVGKKLVLGNVVASA
jgi:hypothetical protein